MMMVHGLFVFGISSAAYQDLKRQTQWRHASQSRVGARSARQFVGIGIDSISLSGILLPEFTGGQPHLDELRRLADEGKGWTLIEGTGENYGTYVIESLGEGKSRFFRDGAATSIEFDLQLSRIDDDRPELLGTLDASALRLIRGAFA